MTELMIEQKLAAVDQSPKDILKALLRRLGRFDMGNCGGDFVVRRRATEGRKVKLADRVFWSGFVFEESSNAIVLVMSFESFLIIFYCESTV